MSTGFFDVLKSDDTSSDEESGDNNNKNNEEEEDISCSGGATPTEAARRHHHREKTIRTNNHSFFVTAATANNQLDKKQAPAAAPAAPAAPPVSIPSYEDLSSSRADEETVLQAIYGSDFSRTTGVWGCARLEVQTKPPDIEPSRVGSDVLLSVQLGKYYPYVAPSIELRKVRGLSQQEQRELLALLKERAAELATSGSVMVSELVQSTEDFLLQHNRDPTMSAWEQMKAREKTEREQEENVQLELSRLMNSPREALSPVHSMTRTTLNDASSSGVVERIAAEATADVERELQRQREALQAAQRPRAVAVAAADADIPVLRRDSSAISQGEDDDDEDDDEIDFDFNADHQVLAGASRYKTDFIELGILGRGGGGEVVKVRNRLDRRIYAIKKILLESERGRSAKFGAIQNRKLRREVTTISRMTHQFIVRYYQAWVEGEADTIEEEESAAKEVSALDVIDDENSEDIVSEDSSTSGRGWWTGSGSQRRPSWSGKESSLGDDDSSNDDTSNALSSQKLRSASMLNLLEQENDQALQSPLLTGLGFQNQAYQNILDNREKDLQNQSHDSDIWDELDESSAKVNSESPGRKILYIQMQYCATTLRKLIDEKAVESMEDNEVWRLVRQMLEALAYIHSRNIIHRDLKPGNVFLDTENNVQLGDFGLATKHESKLTSNTNKEDDESEASAIYSSIEDISRLMGGSHSSKISTTDQSWAGESMTGGVGTTFYRAPEQEGQVGTRTKGDSSSYTVQADIFSFGVILFEMFHPPFETYMERAETLTTLRGDRQPEPSKSADVPLGFRQLAESRFPKAFVESVPENAQRLILLCLERDPLKRPSAEDLLKSDLLPRKIELEQRYLEEALQLLTSSQSDSYVQILNALFARPTLDVVNFTFDTDVAVKANNMSHVRGGKRIASPPELLVRAVAEIRSGALDMSALGSIAMSASSLLAATSALNRARHTGKLGKGGRGMIKRAAQRTAGIMAMRAATAAAVTGAHDGVHGADPVVVECINRSIVSIFQNHGAVLLKSPLLRPRPSHAASLSSSTGGPAEVINSRGAVLVLPEDLTAPFARALGRGGSATSNLKRYDIDRVFHRALAGGHPRESMEASFDIVHEEHNNAREMLGETIIVASEVIGILPSHEYEKKLPFGARSPIWFLRLSHTRLADSILELCGVPPKEGVRLVVLGILTRFTAPSPHALSVYFSTQTSGKQSLHGERAERMKLMELMDKQLNEAASLHGLPATAAEKLRLFMVSCFPLSPVLQESIEELKQAIAKLRTLDSSKSNVEPRRMKRYEEAARSLKSLKDLAGMIQLHLHPLVGSPNVEETSLSRPLFVSIDLGLRQRRKHYHGGILYQCIVLPNTYFDEPRLDEHNDKLISSEGRGTKVAEGGEYSDLVRKNRPPGNFASTLFTQYTTAPIPFACGVRFAIGKFVELVYVDSALLDPEEASGDNSNTNEIQQMRKMLGHPLSFTEPVHCIVASVHGMDNSSVPERFLVASRLWAEGVSAEYLAQSGVMLSLLKRIREESQDSASASDWSLTELYGVCALLKIPWVVIVQPHLLKDKKSVRLRRVAFDSQGQTGNISTTGEQFVSMDDLASTIKESNDVDEGPDANVESFSGQVAIHSQSSRGVEVECYFIDNDVYYSTTLSKNESPHWKSVNKAIKRVEHSAKAFMSSLGTATDGGGMRDIPVFAVTDVSFWAIRDFGTALMRRERQEQSSNGAFTETAEKYPKFKRSLKTLSIAIDNFMKRQGIWTTSTNHHPHHHHHGGHHDTSLLTALLYSKNDDRFDVFSVSHRGTSSRIGPSSSSSSTRRR